MKPKPTGKITESAPARSTEAPVVRSSRTPQSVDEVESYWTEERMADAQPLDSTRPGGGSPAPSTPAPTGVTVPGERPWNELDSANVRQAELEVPAGIA